MSEILLGLQSTNDSTGGIWGERLDELRLYKMEHGDVNVPRVYAPNRSLAVWVAGQREKYHKMQQGEHSHHMTAAKVAALEKLGFKWRIRPKSAPWKERLEELRKYKQQHGNVNIPQRYHPNLSLARWVNTQRKEYHKMQQGKHSLMTAERVAALEELGFAWKILPSASWEKRLEELRKYKKQHGDVNVPARYHRNKSLGRWVSDQRSEYQKMQKGGPTRLTAERVAELEKLGFKWRVYSTPIRALWEERLEELREYKQQHGEEIGFVWKLNSRSSGPAN